ncbi:MAG: metallophosphoesterase family protein [Propionibacteriaceae bacterium]|nr:metallophosphoesterase family protein [Propionibacteriaceae bacterium]
METRIALISDVHGNITALRAVIEDAQRQGATEFWLLGDTFMPGPAGQDLFDLLDGVNTTVWMLGNWDEVGMITALRGELALNDATDVYLTRLSMFVHANIGDAGVARIASWSPALTRQVGGVTVSISHNLPTKNWGGALMPYEPQANFDAIFDDNPADVAVVGHTHIPMLRSSEPGRLIINPGSAGQTISFNGPGTPRPPRVQYAMLVISDQGIDQIDFRAVPFDIDAELAHANRVGLPYVDLYEEMLRLGTSFTHDLALLDDINHQRGYQDDVHEFLDSAPSDNAPP